MNKLVSKHPVLRFKLGKKIEKFQLGKNFKRVGTANNGLSGIYFNPDDSKLYKGTLTGYDYIGDSYKYTNYGTGKTGVINASEYIKKPITGKTNINVNEELKVLNKLNSKSNSTKSGIKAEYKKKSIPRNGWSYGYNRSNEISDIKAMLNKLIKLGLLKDRFGADGKWGDNTEAAYLKYLSLKNIPTYTKAELTDSTPATPTILKEPVLQNDFSSQKSAGYPSSLSRGEQLLNSITLRPEFKYGYGNYRNFNPIRLDLRPMFKQGGQLISKNPVKRFKSNFR